MLLHLRSPVECSRPTQKEGPSDLALLFPPIIILPPCSPSTLSVRASKSFLRIKSSRTKQASQTDHSMKECPVGPLLQTQCQWLW
jgi:hypothetical protein